MGTKNAFPHTSREGPIDVPFVRQDVCIQPFRVRADATCGQFSTETRLRMGMTAYKGPLPSDLYDRCTVNRQIRVVDFRCLVISDPYSQVM